MKEWGSKPKPRPTYSYEPNLAAHRTHLPGGHFSTTGDERHNEKQEDQGDKEEGAVVIHKIDRGLALNAEEQAIRDAMNTNYTKLKNLISQVRSAATVSEVEVIEWT